MRRRKLSMCNWFNVAVLTAVLLSSVYFQQQALAAASDIYGVVTKLTGKVRIQLRVDLRWDPGSVGMPVQKGTKIDTGSDGEAEIVFEDGNAIKLANNTLISVEEAKQSNQVNKFLLLLTRGRITSNTTKIRIGGKTFNLEYTIRTPVAVLCVRGSIFIVGHSQETGTEKEKSEVAVFKGVVSAVGEIGSEITVEENHQTEIHPGEAPHKPHPIEARLLKYYEEKVKIFNERVEYHRKRLDKIRQQYLKWMEREKQKYEQKMCQEKQKHKKRFEKLKKKHKLE